MGHCSSKDRDIPKPSAKPKAPAKPPKDRSKLNPADFVLSKLTGEVIVKNEGSIDGEQFNIEECKKCNIYLCDTVATAFVDDCEECNIFVGPTETSVMLRNCKSCNLIIACQQFRCRDCEDCKIALLCMTEPIIETSSKMHFACFDFTYFSLGHHLSQARLKPWNNKWWMIYDFNRNEASPNWDLFPQEEVRKMIPPQETDIEPVVPVTLGSRPRPSEEICFVIFLPDSDPLVEAFISKADKSASWSLVRARTTTLAEDRLKALFLWAKEPKLVSSLKGKEITGVEICGPRVYEEVQEALTSTGLASGAKQIRVPPEKDASDLARFFFEMWKDEI